MHQKADPANKVLRSPKNYLIRDDHYTIETSGGRDLQVENALGKTEAAFGEFMARLESNQSRRPKDDVFLSFFVASMLARVEPFTGAVESMLSTVHRQAKEIEKEFGCDSRLSNEVAESLQGNPGKTVRAAVLGNQETLARMNLKILRVDDEDGLVTSDAPVCLCDPTCPLPPYLGACGVEVTLPLSPRHLAIYVWPPRQVRGELGTRQLVDEINARTVGDCLREFVSWKGVVRNEGLTRARP